MNGRRNDETLVYEQLAEYLSYKHRDLIGLWHFDLAGIHNPSPVSRSLYSRLNERGFPDFTLYFPVFYPHTVIAGLAIEIKGEAVRLRKRDGGWASAHIAEQAATLELLRQAGWVAEFGVGIDDCIRILEDYLAPIKAKDVMRPLLGKPVYRDDTAEAVEEVF